MTEGTATTADGRPLRYERHGTGQPIVVCEAGMGVSRAMWGGVVPLVAETTTVVAYDRAGLGGSAPDREPRTLTRLADDLGALLDALGPDPFVLVGHSWGGPVVRTLAAERPDRVAGLVLVDQTDEGCELFFSKAMARQDRIAPVTVTVLARTRVLRLVVNRQAALLPEPWASSMKAVDGTPGAVDAQLAEMRSYPAELRRIRDDPLAVPDVPVTVISGGKVGFMEKNRREPLVEAHRRRAEAAPQGRHVVAAGSGHLVPLTEPDLVAAEILRVVEAARA